MTDVIYPRVAIGSTSCIVKDSHGEQASYPRYKYNPLSARKIRLLKLEHRTLQWPVFSLDSMNEYSLVEHELEDTNRNRLNVSDSPYVPISYYWGQPIYDAPLVITVQGQKTILPITGGAWEAIERTLPAIGAHGKLMWIDQACIDQENLPEREHQVSLMGDIYLRCWHCMIWLGAAGLNTSLAFALLRRLHQDFDFQQRIPLDERQVADLSHAQIRTELASNIGRDLLPPSTDAGWVEIARLLQRDWFSRLWTFQEAVLCYKGDATICCGNYYIPLTTFMRASMFLGNEHSFAGINFTAGRSLLAQISSFRFQIEHGQLTPLISLLQNNVGRNCLVPSDRIFALLGLRNEDGPTFAIQVNYNKSPECLFTEVARKIIQSQRTLRICADAPERLPGGALVDLPSWVPNWTRRPIANAFELLSPSHFYFNAHNGIPHVDRICHSQILRVEGRTVDSIVYTIDTEVPDGVTQEERRLALIEYVLPMLLGTLQSYAPSMSSATLAYTVINTITLGGFTRANNQGDMRLEADAWSESTCDHVISYLLHGLPHSSTPIVDVDLERWLYALTRQAIACTNRKFAVLENSLLGLLPKSSRVGDLIVILHGSSLPFVLRGVNQGYYRMIGICYVDKLMHGERVTWEVGDVFQIC